MIESYTDSVQRYEAVFTKQFEDKGFKWDVYVKTDDLKDFTDYPLLVCPTLLLRRKMPAVQAPQLYARAGGLSQRHGR